MNNLKTPAIVTFVSIVSVFLLLSSVGLGQPFTPFQFASSDVFDHFVESGDMSGIVVEESRFLWNQRGLDLFVQSFIIVATTVCCMAMLKPESEK